MLRPVSVLVLLLALAGCAEAPKPYQGLDYAQEKGVSLNVGAVLVDSSFKPSGETPYIEHQLVPQPEDALRTAITQHYRSARPNTSGLASLRFTIKEATVTETALSQPTNWFTRQTSKAPEYQYTGHLVVESKTEGAARYSGYVNAEASRSLEVGHMSPAERTRQVNGMVTQMVDDVIRQLDEQINTNMSGYVLSGEEMTIVPQPSGRWDKVMEWK